jgi:hypothetical protein
MRWILSAAAALLVSAAVAQAPQPSDGGPPLPPRYEVEVLVFAHRTFDPSEERFDYAPSGFGSDAQLREAPVFDDAFLNAPLDRVPAPPPQAEPPLPPAPPSPEQLAAEQRAAAMRVVPLRPEELKLGTEYRRLRNLAAYEPLVHAGWVQPGLPEAESTPFELKTLGIINPRGSVRVHLSRFLHITLDLTYQAASGSGTATSGADGLEEIVLAPQYRLQATRSARSNELHYFDHPAFGVLVRVTPVPAQDGGAGRRPAA